MALYARLNKPILKIPGNYRVMGGEGLSRIVEDNPLSLSFRLPFSNPSTKAIYNYMVAVQQRQYKRVIDLSEFVVRAHIKRALKEHSAEYICRAIRWASMVSHYPFGIPFALRSLDNACERYGLQFRHPAREVYCPSDSKSLFG